MGTEQDLTLPFRGPSVYTGVWVSVTAASGLGVKGAVQTVVLYTVCRAGGQGGCSLPPQGSALTEDSLLL